jgi:hypothetical protein
MPPNTLEWEMSKVLRTVQFSAERRHCGGMWNMALAFLRATSGSWVTMYNLVACSWSSYAVGEWNCLAYRHWPMSMLLLPLVYTADKGTGSGCLRSCTFVYGALSLLLVASARCFMVRMNHGCKPFV